MKREHGVSSVSCLASSGQFEIVIASVAKQSRIVENERVVIARLDRAIQYAAAYRFNPRRLWILDRPPPRAMTTEYAYAISRRG